VMIGSIQCRVSSEVHVNGWRISGVATEKQRASQAWRVMLAKGKVSVPEL
jgi:hypothetical protein